jgi:hypothetical protein
VLLETGAQLRVQGRFHSPLPLLARFAAKCRFDPFTGCVLWIGGTTAGRGNTARYGSFWDADEKRRWSAHRWAAQHIHKLDLTSGLTVGHCCPHTHDGHPNPLCVEHLALQTLGYNIAEGNRRRGKPRGEQSSLQRQFWLFVDRGIEPPPEITAGSENDPVAVPYFSPPAWLVPFLPKAELTDECPF